MFKQLVSASLPTNLRVDMNVRVCSLAAVVTAVSVLFLTHFGRASITGGETSAGLTTWQMWQMPRA